MISDLRGFVFFIFLMEIAICFIWNSLTGILSITIILDKRRKLISYI